MGRWGYTLFQGDNDLDLVSEFEAAVGTSIHDEPAKLEEARKKLDAGMGAELFSKYRAKEQEAENEISFSDPRYTTLILGAYMMHMGAQINSDDRQHLNDIFTKIPSKNGYVPPICGDNSFRDPGQAQYKAALENYVNGTPRSFLESSCFNCGKTSKDLTPANLKKCMGCDHASYCNKDCQKENWKKHKVICGPRSSNGRFQMLNV